MRYSPRSLTLAILILASTLHAQGRGVSGPRSPEIAADGKVTFRLQAPGAKSVQLLGDFTGKTLEMTKSDAGVWSLTTDPLKPGSYQYWFVMDGLTMPDPVNTYVRPASGVYKSQFDVPGPEADWLSFRDVPHGTLHEHWYLNKDNGTARRVVVYTPPGYNGADDKPYPVLYLLHGANDFERGWTQAGNANWIMDNLLAQKKTRPALIVMPFGHDVTGASGKQAEIKAFQKSLGIQPATRPAAGARGGAFGSGGSYMERDLLTNVIPLVEREYHTLQDPNHRAIFGYSMGGGHSTTIGLNHPERFAYVAGMSGFAGQNAIAKALADPDKTNQQYKLIWAGCGTEDPIAFAGGKSFDKLLTAKNIRHEWVESPGYRHDYQIWRIYLHDLLPRLFND